jgi:hypothetical protein
MTPNKQELCGGLGRERPSRFLMLEMSDRNDDPKKISAFREFHNAQKLRVNHTPL